MTKQHVESVIKNTMVMMVSQIITWVSSFVLLMFLPKYLGSKNYGELYLAISITLMFQVLIEFGGQYHITKEVSRSRDYAPFILSDSALSRLLLWIASLCLMFIFSMIAGYTWQVVLLITILGVAKLWEGINSLLRNCFQGFEMMEFPSVGSVVERLFLAITVITALLIGFGEITIALLMAISTLVNFILTFYFSKKIIRFFPGFRLKRTLQFLKQGVPYFLWSVFATLYYRVDVIMLSLMTTYSVVGWYGAAYKLFDVLMFFPYIFSQSLFPVLSRMAETTQDSLSKALRKSLNITMFVGLPISILLFSFPQQIIGFLFGLEEYERSAVLLQIFSIGLLLVYIDFILGAIVMATDKQKKWSKIAGVAIFLNIGLNYLAIPFTQDNFGNGGIGAAVATIITELYIMTCAIILLKNTVTRPIEIGFLGKLFTGGSVMYLSILLMKSFNLIWFVQVIVSPGIYLSLLGLFKIFSKDEMESFNPHSVIKNLFNTLWIKNKKGVNA